MITSNIYDISDPVSGITLSTWLEYSLNPHSFNSPWIRYESPQSGERGTEAQRREKPCLRPHRSCWQLACRVWDAATLSLVLVDNWALEEERRGNFQVPNLWGGGKLQWKEKADALRSGSQDLAKGPSSWCWGSSAHSGQEWGAKQVCVKLAFLKALSSNCGEKLPTQLEETEGDITFLGMWGIGATSEKQIPRAFPMRGCELLHPLHDRGISSKTKKLALDPSRPAPNHSVEILTQCRISTNRLQCIEFLLLWSLKLSGEM